MMLAEELAIQTLHGITGRVAASARSGNNADLDPTLQRSVRPNRPQQTADGIGKVVVQEILELRVSQDRKQFGHQSHVGVPGFEPCRKAFVVHVGEGTQRVVGRDRIENRLPLGGAAVQHQADLRAE